MIYLNKPFFLINYICVKINILHVLQEIDINFIVFFGLIIQISNMEGWQCIRT